jgi:hypothetical protein
MGQTNAVAKGILEAHDPNLVQLDAGNGTVLVSPGLQGRIFCALGNELVHRLDAEGLENPVAGEFQNLGGNSLWPAPEGGAYAFNYPPESGEWYVQKDIAETPAEARSIDGGQAHIGKTITLLNRRGISVRLEFDRRVRASGRESWPDADGLESVAYCCEDTFTPAEAYPADQVLLAPWSLEQFPGGTDVTAFARVRNPKNAINFDFYGMPEKPPAFGPDSFTLELGGEARFQLGVRVANRPDLLGALDRRRQLLILRRMEPADGAYFNIADNDQPGGPWSAADMFSVFNGGDLDFFELETIAPMQTENNRLAMSSLLSDTLILRGPVGKLAGYVRKHWNVEVN